jgi:DNA-binding transcriptional ArsR family regulator
MRRDVFQAIADPTRRAILVLIASQTMTPNALAEHFDITRQAVSKHIKILNECQLLKQEKAGREIYYHFNPTKMKEIDKWLSQFRQHWEDRFNQLDEVLTNLNSDKNEK